MSLADLLKMAIVLDVKLRLTQEKNSRFDFKTNTICLKQNVTVEDLAHELSHALQWRKGNQEKFELLGIKPSERAIALAHYHHPLHRPIEIEAYTLEVQPRELIMLALAIAPLQMAKFRL